MPDTTIEYDDPNYRPNMPRVDSTTADTDHALVPQKKAPAKLKTAYEATADWRLSNKEKYNQYMREYMQKRRLAEKK